MGAFVSKRPVRVKAEDGSGEWIDVKAKLSAGDQRDVLNSSAVGMGDDATITIGSSAYAMMETGFVDWLLLEPTLDDEGKPVLDADGNEVMSPVPFSKEAIANLDSDHPLVDRAITRIAELNPTLSGLKGKRGSENSEKATP